MGYWGSFVCCLLLTQLSPIMKLFINLVDDLIITSLHTGISYWETSQTADSGIILNKRLNKERKIYLREDDTHLVFLVSQHKPCCVIAGSHQHRPSSPRSPRSVPSSRIIYHQHTRTLLFTTKSFSLLRLQALC